MSSAPTGNVGAGGNILTNELTSANIVQPPRYTIVDNRLCLIRSSKNVVTVVPLANFVAWIVKEESVRPRGQKYLRGELVPLRPGYRVYTVEATLDTGEPLPSVYIKAKDFPSLGWIREEWGSRAIIYPGNTKAHVAAAIQTVRAVAA